MKEGKQNGCELISQERRRQVEEEGYGAEHDDKYHDLALAVAGASYALHIAACGIESSNVWNKHYTEMSSKCWPFARECFKPTPDDPVRQLTKAGALIAAEIDRIQGTTPNTTVFWSSIIDALHKGAWGNYMAIHYLEGMALHNLIGLPETNEETINRLTAEAKDNEKECVEVARKLQNLLPKKKIVVEGLMTDGERRAYEQGKADRDVEIEEARLASE